MITNDKPQSAPPATPKERKMIFDKLLQHFSSSKILNLDGEKRQGLRSSNKNDNPVSAKK